MTAAERRQLAQVAGFARDQGYDASVFGDSVTIWIEGAEYEVRSLEQARQVIGP